MPGGGQACRLGRCCNPGIAWLARATYPVARPGAAPPGKAPVSAWQWPLLEFPARFTPLNRWNIAAIVQRAWEGFQPGFHFTLVDIRDAHTFNAAP